MYAISLSVSHRKVLTQWANLFLQDLQPTLSVHDVCEDLQDGLVIIALIEKIAGKSFNLKYNRAPRFPGKIGLLVSISLGRSEVR